MKYAILFYQSAAEFDRRDDPVDGGAYRGAWGAYIQAVQAAGIAQAGAGLEAPRTGTTIRLRDGKRHVQDGPFADTKEQLAGLFVVDVPDLDVAARLGGAQSRRGLRRRRGAPGAAARAGQRVTTSVHRAAEAAARNSYGRLVALLAMRSRDIAAAQDALVRGLSPGARHAGPRAACRTNPKPGC